MDFPLISLSLIHEIFAEKLQFRKLCSHWVPKILIEHHQKQRLQFLTHYNEDDDDFLSLIVTVDETWVSYDTFERFFFPMAGSKS